MHREKLNRGHAQADQVRNFLDHARKCPGLAYTRRRVPGKSAHMHFVDDRFRERNIQRLIVTPVEGIFYKGAAAGVFTRKRGGAPPRIAGDDLGVRV